MNKIYKGSVLFRSGFDNGNAADEIILDIQRAWFPEYQHIVMVRKASREYEALHPGITTVEGLEHNSFEEAKGRNFRGFNYGDSPEIFNYLLTILKQVSLLVIGHGPYFNTHHNSIARGLLSEMGLLVWLAQITNTPVVLTGMSATGLGSLEVWNRELMNWVLRTVDGCIFRDALSRQNLTTAGVDEAKRWPVMPDAMLSHETDVPPRTPGDANRLIIAPRNVSHLSGGVDRQLTDTLVDVGVRWLKESTGNTVRLIPQLISRDVDDPNNDMNKCIEMKNLFPSDVSDRVRIWMPCPDNSEEWWLQVLRGYEGAETLISVRHHASVFGVLKEVPYIFPINYDDKVEGFWGSVFAQRPIDVLVDADALWEMIKTKRKFFTPVEPNPAISTYYKQQIDQFIRRV